MPPKTIYDIAEESPCKAALHDWTPYFNENYQKWTLGKFIDDFVGNIKRFVIDREDEDSSSVIFDLKAAYKESIIKLSKSLNLKVTETVEEGLCVIYVDISPVKKHKELYNEIVEYFKEKAGGDLELKFASHSPNSVTDCGVIEGPKEQSENLIQAQEILQEIPEEALTESQTKNKNRLCPASWFRKFQIKTKEVQNESSKIKSDSNQKETAVPKTIYDKEDDSNFYTFEGSSSSDEFLGGVCSTMSSFQRSPGLSYNVFHSKTRYKRRFQIDSCVGEENIGKSSDDSKDIKKESTGLIQRLSSAFSQYLCTSVPRTDSDTNLSKRLEKELIETKKELELTKRKLLRLNIVQEG